MDYKELITKIKKVSTGLEEDGAKKCASVLLDAATAITDLLARAEAVEARCSALEKMVKEYQENLIPGYRVRAEKAERERGAAIKWIREFVESIDMPCKGCKNDTGDYVALGLCGGCSKENDKWQWNGGQKEE